MPSASAKLEKQLSNDGADSMKQITTMVEKKVRNLEKRKTKLDSYRHDCENGKELNEDQKKAIEKYDQVVEVLEFAKELQKSFSVIIQDTSKAQKKVAKREYLERQQQELQRIKEIMVIQDILNSMGGDSVRNDFLNATNGAVKLSEEELNSLDELFKLICPERDMSSPDSSEFEKQLLSSAEHLQCLLDSRNKEIIGTTYKVMKEIVMKIHSCNYFNKTEVVQPTEENEGEDAAEVETVKENESVDNDDHHLFHHADDNKQVEAPQASVDRPFYQNEAPFKDKSRPIQEVLPVQGNLNFLQDSQIDLESPSLEQPSIAPHSVPSGYGSNFVSVSQTPVSSLDSPRFQQQRVKEDTTLSAHMVPSLSAVSVPSQQQPSSGLGFVSSAMQSGGVRPADFDPTRPIPTQTFTNQSFASPMHPMMQQNYVPVTLPHGLQSQHILPTTMVPQSIPQRNLVTTSSGVLDHASLSVHAQAGGSHPISKLNLGNHDAKDHFVSRSFPMHQVSGDSHHLVKTNTSNSQYDRLNTHDAYQSLNKEQSFMSHENFSTDSSSYSSNLKRGLTHRGVPRASGNRGAVSNVSRGHRGYRN